MNKIILKMDEKKLTRRERQAELLKKEILEAAVETFKQYGYEKSTTKKIAKTAEVSEGTLYYYFKNKRDILITLFQILIENINTNLGLVLSDNDDITKLLSKGMTRQYEQINTFPIITLFLHEARLDPEVKKVFSEMIALVRESGVNLLKELENKGKIRKINHETVALLMSLAGIGYMALYETGDKFLTKLPLSKLTDEFAQVLVNGLMPVN